jgi:hypothetical protein
MELPFLLLQCDDVKRVADSWQLVKSTQGT